MVEINTLFFCKEKMTENDSVSDGTLSPEKLSVTTNAEDHTRTVVITDTEEHALPPVDPAQKLLYVDIVPHSFHGFDQRMKPRTYKEAQIRLSYWRHECDVVRDVLDKRLPLSYLPFHGDSAAEISMYHDQCKKNLRQAQRDLRSYSVTIRS